MIAPLGTLAFLATLWLLVVVGAAVLEDSGAKIAADFIANPAQSLDTACADRAARITRRGGQIHFSKRRAQINFAVGN